MIVLFKSKKVIVNYFDIGLLIRYWFTKLKITGPDIFISGLFLLLNRGSKQIIKYITAINNIKAEFTLFH